MASIDKNELERLANLARLELNPNEEEKFIKDFSKILDHFNELSELPARPISNARPRRVVLREDADTQPNHFNNQEAVVAEFPEKEGRLLKIPPIFE
jgi:aspartyl-tRNA(Asn)/glutamyl-tRNA(Gln) amidotransferase subunit C